MNKQKLLPGQSGTTFGFNATVVRHYDGSMYEVRVPGGLVCIDAGDFKPDTKQVQYESVWGDGSIVTSAVLNLRTGEVSDIKVSDGGEYYGNLQYEEIFDATNGATAIVEPNDSGKHFLKDLSMLPQFGGASIQQEQVRPRG